MSAVNEALSVDKHHPPSSCRFAARASNAGGFRASHSSERNSARKVKRIQATHLRGVAWRGGREGYLPVTSVAVSLAFSVVVVPEVLAFFAFFCTFAAPSWAPCTSCF